MTESCSTGCGCADCRGAEDARPFAADAFRAGSVFERMRQRIHGWRVGGMQPLAAMGTSDPADPAIALMAAWAGALHVIGWNAARLADDGTITRGTDRAALTSLTALLGYVPRPALSSTTTLALMVDDLPGAPASITVPKATRIASVPLEGGMPISFETDAALRAERAWNALLPLPRPDPPRIEAATTRITIAGTASPVRPGDLLLAYANPQVSPEKWLVARISRVSRDPAGLPPATHLDLTEAAMLAAPTALQGAAFAGTVCILGQRATAFGATAPDLALMTDKVILAQVVPPATTATEWKNLVMFPGANGGSSTTQGAVDLDGISGDAAAGKAVLFAAPGKTTGIGTITAASETARAAFGLSAKVSRIAVNGVDLTIATGFGNLVRATTIWIETAREQLVVPNLVHALPDATTPDRITVQGAVALPPGRVVMLTGTLWGSDTAGAERAEIATALPDATSGTTLLQFASAPVQQFASDSLQVLGNCAAASQGETAPGGAEILGSGDAAVLAPRFGLRGGPVAQLPAAGPRGYAPAIELRVNDRLYDAAATLWSLPEAARAFTLRETPEGGAEVQLSGRLPSGTHNVTALYRTGGGAAGNLDAGRICTIMTPVVGLKSATNPQRSEGGSDPETAEALRMAAPVTVRTLERVVSTGDFQAFAVGYRGIGKALASDLAQGMRRVLCLTIATTDLVAPVAGSDILSGLRTELARVAVPGRIIRIEGFDDFFAVPGIALATDSALPRAMIEAAVRAALAQRFGKPARGFAEGLHRSQVLACVQAVPGVLAARLTGFALSPPGLPENAGRLLCPGPRFEGTVFRRAGLLSIDPDQVTFSEMLP